MTAHLPHPLLAFDAEQSPDDPAHVFVTFTGTTLGDPGPYLIDLNDPALAAEQLYEAVTGARIQTSWGDALAGLDPAYHLLLTTYG